MKDQVNFYLSMFIMFIAGAGAMWVIIHIATTSTPATVVGGSEASYDNLKQSILKP